MLYSPGMGVRKVSDSKVTFTFTQGHWYFFHSIGHIGLRFPISLSIATVLLSCTFRDIITYFPKFKDYKEDIHGPEHIPSGVTYRACSRLLHYYRPTPQYQSAHEI